MATDLIIHLIEVILFALVIGWINKSSWKVVTPDIQGRYYLKMNKAYQYTGYICVVLSSVFALAPWFVDDPDLFFAVLMFGVFAMFLILGAICIMYYKSHYLLFDKHGIEVQSFRKVISTASWHEISGGRIKTFSGNIELNLLNRADRIKINRHLVGLPSFLQELESKTGISSNDLGFPADIW